MKWYVVQVYPGYEESVKKDIERRIVEEGVEYLFGKVLIPSAKLKQMFALASDVTEQQLFPGYLLIEMSPEQQSMRLVLSTLRVIRFLGGKDPAPLTPHEVERIMSQMKGEVKVSSRKADFIEGGEVEIADGPFAGFVGIIDKVDSENERLTVMVSIFGRMTPVELGFEQVKR